MNNITCVFGQCCISLCSQRDVSPLGPAEGLCSLFGLMGGTFHSAIMCVRALLTFPLRSLGEGDPKGVLSEPLGVLEGEANWLQGHPVSSERDSEEAADHSIKTKVAVY